MSFRNKFDINNKPVHLQKVLTEEDASFELSCIRQFNHESKEDYQMWCSIVNAAYEEENYVAETAKETLMNHSFLCNTETYFYLDEHGTPIGTISIGSYRDALDVAGDFRLAVNPDYQNLGIGGGLIKYANHRMYLRGHRLAESIISYKRNTSLYLHYKCGYKPQKTINRWALKSNFLNYILGFDRKTIKKAEEIYQAYLNKHKGR